MACAAGVAANRSAPNDTLMQVVIEPKMLGAIEYTVSVIQSPEGCVIALPPSTVEVVDFNSDIQDHLNEVDVGLLEQEIGQAVEQVPLFDDMNPSTTFFSYGRKYRPNEEVRTHTPPKLEAKMVQVPVPRLNDRVTMLHFNQSCVPGAWGLSPPPNRRHCHLVSVPTSVP